MKVRIVQDHHFNVQPWYRLEKWLEERERWSYVDSSGDVKQLRTQMQRIITPPPGPAFTVIEEREV